MMPSLRVPVWHPDFNSAEILQSLPASLTGQLFMKRLIVGISGASGAIYGVRLLQVLRDVTDIETHLVMSGRAPDLIPRNGFFPARSAGVMM